MKGIFTCLIFYLIFIRTINCSNCVDKTKATDIPQGQQNVPVVLTIGKVGEDVRLPCHFCNERVGITGRLWRRKSLHGIERVVDLDMHDDDSKNRVFAAEDHSLVIREINEQDGAYYRCYDVENAANIPKMEILLDVGYRTTLEPIVLQNIPEVSTYGCYVEWGAWSNCDNCGKLAERRRVGECRLQKYTKVQMQVAGGQTIVADLPSVGVGCHSFLLDDVPEAKEILSEIPNIVLIENCEVSCDNYVKKAKKLIAFKKSSYLKKVKMKFKEKMKTVSKAVKAEIKEETEGTSLTLFCPGASIETKIKWKFKETFLKPEKLKERTAGRVYIDPTDALHIKSLRAADTGEYVCTLLGVEIGLIRLKVKSRHKAFDPTSNFGLLTIGMLLSFLVWIVFMSLKWRMFMLQRRAQRRRLRIDEQEESSSILMDSEEYESNDLLESPDESSSWKVESSILRKPDNSYSMNLKL